jgi:transposase InsO family protein
MMPIADDALRERLRLLSAEHPRWGYRLAWGAVRAEGWAVNRKKIQRLWREEGLRVPLPRPKEPSTTDPNSHSGGWTDKRGPVTRLTALPAND